MKFIRHISGVACCLLMAASAPPVSTAQTGAGDSIAQAAAAPGGRFLGITTDPPGALVYLDSILLGRSPLVVRLPEPSRARAGAASILTISGGEPGRWFAPVATDTLRPGGGGAGIAGGGGDTMALHYSLPVAARITSDPPGADVVLGDSLLGSTPLFASLPRSVSTVRLRKAGYREESVLIDPATFNYRVGLVRQDSAGMIAESPLAGLAGEGSTKLVIAGIATVAAGTAAALLKQKADTYYQDYQDTGDPATLDRVRRLDLASAIALAVAEIGIGYLVIELLSR
jgi:hypothetical protein